MSDVSSAMHSEDIELDEGGAAAVIGGAAKNMTMAQAVKAGYSEVSCEPHGTLMRNSKGHEVLVPYK
jgi:hypothetical protein